jgi:hypothetical protein
VDNAASAAGADDNVYDIVFDLGFLANAVSAQMQLIGEAKDNEFFEVLHVELDEDNINVIARKYEVKAN